MKKLTLTTMALLLLAITSRVVAQDEQMMKAWQAYMTPGDVHKMIAKENGPWDAEITNWMSPGAPPSKSKGSCINSMIMGGRYQQSMFTGNMMGMPFEGMSLLGYDNAKKIFTSTWVDNMGTGIITMEGTWDAASKSITLKGKGIDPSTGKDIDMRQVMKMTDPDTQLMEMYCTTNGKEMKTMEVQLTRKK